MHASATLTILVVALCCASNILAAPFQIGGSISLHRHQGDSSETIYKREPVKFKKPGSESGELAGKSFSH